MRTFRLKSLSAKRLRRAVRRAWLIFTAPRWARVRWLGHIRGKRVCDMDDGHVLNALHFFRDRYVHVKDPERYQLMLREARRRHLPTDVKPKWLIKENEGYPARLKAQRERQNARRERILDRIAPLSPLSDSGSFGQGI